MVGHADSARRTVYVNVTLTVAHNCTFLGLSPPPVLRGAQELKTAHNCTFLGLSPPPLSCGAQN